jgi:hypothetical protein
VKAVYLPLKCAVLTVIIDRMENKITLLDCGGLFHAVHLYADLTGLKESTISDRAFGDWRVVGRLRAGQVSVTLNRHNAALRWLANNWPPDTAVPFDIAALRSIPAARGGEIGCKAVTQ